jgi:quinol monooxygenase YgiN
MSEAIVVIARFSAKPGREENALAAFQRVADETHREDGCEKYVWVRALEDPRQFAVVEKWRDRQAIDGHGSSPHLAELRAQLVDLLSEPPSVVRYAELGLGEAGPGWL